MTTSAGWNKTDAYGMKDISGNDLEKNLARVAKTSEEHRTVVVVGTATTDKVRIGAEKVILMAGPCAVTTLEDLEHIARHVKSAGAVMLRGGAYKPLTFPYNDPSTRFKGIQWLHQVAGRFKLPVVTECMEIDDIPHFLEYADMIQVGARNMSNFPLLRKLGEVRKPILLKRHPGMSLRDWLGAAEYILAGGNDQVVLCERGIVAPHTHDPNARFIMDVQAIAAAKSFTHLPVIADPSHSTFNRQYVAPMARAAVAAGADGLLIDVSRYPERDPVDPLQALSYESLDQLIAQLRVISSVFGRTL